MRRIAYTCCVAGLVSVSARAADWPQWRGAGRTGVAEETIKGEWPEGGPKELWKATLGGGYSCPAVVGDRLYIAGNKKVGDELRGFLFALDAASGKELWSADYGPEWTTNYPESRTTPTVAGDKIYIVSGMMDVVCVSTEGKVLGRITLTDRFSGKIPRWGNAESPLVYDDKIIALPGGPDAAVVALSTKNGETLWTSKGLSDGVTYCSPALLTLHGVRQVVTHTDSNLVGLDADTGAVLWKTPYRNQRTIHPNTPLLVDADTIAVSSGYKFETRLYRISKNTEGSFAAEQLWSNTDADNHHHGLILHNGTLFCASTQGGLCAIDPKTGKTLYRIAELPSGSLVKTSERLIGYAEKGGAVCLVEADVEKYAIKGTFPVTYGEGPHWAHPVVANGQLYIRHGAVLAAYDVK